MAGETKKAIVFLQTFAPKGKWVLTAVAIDRKSVDTRTFSNENALVAASWLDKYNGYRNIYFSVNQPNRELTSKANKEDILEAHWLHVDVDPAEGQNLSEERERILSMLTDRLPRGIPQPTVIIFSGGGYQAFWRLKIPVIIDGNLQSAEEFELYNRRLEQIFGGDKCHNVDRIMRLPGTINIPDAKKIKRGRKEELAKVLLFEHKNIYDLDQFKKAHDVQSNRMEHDGGKYGVDVHIPGNIERILDLSELDKWNVPDRVKIIIAQGHHPDQPKERDNSRSAWLFDCVCSLVRANVPDEVIFSIITDPEWGIATSVVELKGGGEKYAIRQIKRAKEHTEDPHLAMMNDRHAIIGNIGGKCRVIEEISDDILRRSRITTSSFEDIRNRYSHLKVKVGSDKEGKELLIPLGKYWLGHHMRRQFDTMKFMPQGDKDGIYNLWRGFSVEPKPGDCNLYLEHIKKNICKDNEDHYDYIIKWMARAVQYPASPGEVAIVLRGGKGTGKSIYSTTFGKLFGRHYLQISNPSHLVGNFNAHLRDVILLFADEAFYANDKKHESVLKMLVTEDSIPIEMKGFDVEPYPNYVHLIMAANDQHVIRATGDERRYFVLEVGEENKQDKKFFGDMIAQMESGGYEALLYLLQEVDLSGFQVRSIPESEALKEQKILSLGTEEEWWFRKIQDGRILQNDAEWTGQVAADALMHDYTVYAERWKVYRRGSETSLSRFLARTNHHLTKIQKRVTLEEYDKEGRPHRISKRIYFYDFGTLDQCRLSWERIYGKTSWLDPIYLDKDQPVEAPF